MTLILHEIQSVCKALSPRAADAKPKARTPFTAKRRKHPPATVYLLCRASWQPICAIYAGGSKSSAYHTEWSDYVCVDAVGQFIKPDLVTRNFPLLLNRIGLRHIRFHDLRYSCANLPPEEGTSLKEVQD